MSTESSDKKSRVDAPWRCASQKWNASAHSTTRRGSLTLCKLFFYENFEFLSRFATHCWRVCGLCTKGDDSIVKFFFENEKGFKLPSIAKTCTHEARRCRVYWANGLRVRIFSSSHPRKSSLRNAKERELVVSSHKLPLQTWTDDLPRQTRRPDENSPTIIGLREKKKNKKNIKQQENFTRFPDCIRARSPRLRRERNVSLVTKAKQQQSRMSKRFLRVAMFFADLLLSLNRKLR